MNRQLQQPVIRRNVQLPTMRNLFPGHPMWLKRNICIRRVNETLIKELTDKFNTNLIVNLSHHQLTHLEKQVLAKGLTFVPTPRNPLDTSRDETLSRLTHTMKRQYHFHDKDCQWQRHPFWVPSGWTAPEPQNPNLTHFLEKIKEIPQPPVGNHVTFNLTPRQQNTLKALQTNKNITIKSADKGGGICILDTEDYIAKIRLHLNDTNTYQRLQNDPTDNIRREIISYLDFLSTTGKIDKTTEKFLTPPNPPRLSPFYGIPKIHKPGNPLRPIVSGCDSVTDNLSKYITHFLQPLAEKLPAYIKDTTHFLQELERLPPLPPGAFLVTADVTSLYTNIPHEEGIDAAIHYINLHRKDLPSYTPTNGVFNTLLRFILGNSIFEFMEELYQQITGTSMGTRMAPPYANLFMGRIEGDIVQRFLALLLIWKRFIDDIFFIFLGTENELKQVFEYMNAIHPTIKFTFDYSLTQIPFLDTIVYVDSSRNLQTTLYRKPTDRSCLLHHSSHHPRHVKESIVYTQALRYCTIISEDRNLEKELFHLSKIFLARGYPLSLVREQFQRALSHPRRLLLQPEAEGTNERTEVTPIVTPFNSVGKAVSRKVHHEWHIIENDPTLLEIWPRRPVTAYTRSKNLKDLLVHSKQKKYD